MSLTFRLVIVHVLLGSNYRFEFRCSIFLYISMLNAPLNSELQYSFKNCINYILFNFRCTSSYKVEVQMSFNVRLLMSLKWRWQNYSKVRVYISFKFRFFCVHYTPKFKYRVVSYFFVVFTLFSRLQNPAGAASQVQRVADRRPSPS